MTPETQLKQWEYNMNKTFTGFLTFFFNRPLSWLATYLLTTLWQHFPFCFHISCTIFAIVLSTSKKHFRSPFLLCWANNWISLLFGQLCVSVRFHQPNFKWKALSASINGDICKPRSLLAVGQMIPWSTMLLYSCMYWKITESSECPRYPTLHQINFCSTSNNANIATE